MPKIILLIITTVENLVPNAEFDIRGFHHIIRKNAQFNPEELILLGHGENSIYLIEMELRHTYPYLDIIPVIADVQDRLRMEEVFAEFQPEVVFHAAAHKHVPLMERNPAEAVKNNIFGTKNVARMCSSIWDRTFCLNFNR